MRWTLSVSELNEYVRVSLAGDPMLRDLSLSGEISGFKRQISGHWYFTLKDEKSRISCVFFRQNNLNCPFSPRDGDRVVLRGSVGLYTAQGSYQFYTDSMKKDGQGELYLRFEALKKKLAAEGLFDEARKRPLPLRPRTVAVVTSRSGAVIHDIARVAGRRDPSVQLVLRPALVQGEGAAEDIARGIREAAQVSGADVLIIGRGGGSLEDLWAFNEEIVVAAVHDCGLPVISAVGHEIDFSLTDFAADLRAPTPSAAAELAVPELSKLQDRLTQSRDRLRSALLHGVERKQDRLELLMHRRGGLVTEQRLQQEQQRLDGCRDALEEGIDRRLQKQRDALVTVNARLRAADPLGALDRGFALVYDHQGAILRRAADTAVGQGIALRFRDGRVQADVTGKDLYEKE